MFPRVKEVIGSYKKGGLEEVKKYFNQENMEIDPNTWSGKIKKYLDEGHKLSVATELELLTEKFNFYENVSEKEERTETDSNDGEGDSEIEG